MMASEQTIDAVYEASLARRTHKIDFLSCLQHSARQFVIRRPGERTEVIAGYPWFGPIGRDTFMSLPGITLTQGYKEDCMDVLDTMIRDMRDGDFAGSASATVSADAPLWFYWTLQNLEKTYRPEGAVVALRRGHEVRLGGLSPRHGRRRGGHARQRPDMGCGRQPTPDVDGDYGRRTSRHAARRIRRRDRGVVVQRRHVHLGACTQA